MTEEEIKAAALAKAEADKKAASGTQEPVIDPKIAEIMKDPDAVQKLLEAKRAANEEAKQTRLKLEAREKADKEAEDKKLAEQGEFKILLEKERQEKATVQAEANKKILNLQVRMQAQAEGIIDLDDKNLEGLEGVETDAQGNVKGVKEAVTALKAKKPHLFKTNTVPAEMVETGTGTIPTGKLTKEMLVKDGNKAKELYKSNPALYRQIMGKGS